MSGPFRSAEVVSPDACTHLTGHDHVSSLTVALRGLTEQVYGEVALARPQALGVASTGPPATSAVSRP